MVLRLNEKETNPNIHINFITSLPINNQPNQNDAKELLKSLAAQVRPVMKSEGLAVNSFEEYTFNKVFAGRNWNAGEIIELVLRKPSGQFFPFNFLLNVLCHELAHIKHMNHSRSFHKYNSELRSKVIELRKKGYFGDGYWSSGYRLSDNERIKGESEIRDSDFMDYICGGAQNRSKSSILKPKKRKKPRTRKGMLLGSGNRVDGASLDTDKSNDPNSTFKKRASSNAARQLRLDAVEKRLSMIQSKQVPNQDEGSTTEDEEDYEESDSDRLNLMGNIKSEKPASAWDEFLINSRQEEATIDNSNLNTKKSSKKEIIEID